MAFAREWYGVAPTQLDVELRHVADPNYEHEVGSICAAVNTFADELKRKLVHKATEEDYGGWDDVTSEWLEECQRRLHEHVGRTLQGAPDQEVDVAAFAMFIYYCRRSLERREGGAPEGVAS